MSVEGNINSYYWELVASLAERAKDSDGVERSEAIMQAIDDGLIYYTDQAQQGFVKWGGEVAWDDIYDMLYNDINEEMGEEQRRYYGNTSRF